MIKEISYGIVPIRSSKVLLLRAYDTWDFPKGKPEANEAAIDTAKRELKEESALASPNFIWGIEYAESLPYKRGKKVARYFVAECLYGDVRLLPNPETGIVEHHDFAWLSLDDARSKVHERLHPVVDWVSRIIGSEQFFARKISIEGNEDKQATDTSVHIYGSTVHSPFDDK